MNKYDAIIGLEIHAELNTKSKMFCRCSNDSDTVEPNTNVCPICLGHPGTLPMPNKQAIENNILLGLALGCQINRLSKFDRKNYFYPDLPKGYQISQYDLPFAYGGHLEIDGERIDITRIHLEEDTGKSFHGRGGSTLIDFNRAGTPLIELVTEPMIKDASQAKRFCQKYQQILRYLDISRADMEKGEMRCEANVSVQEHGAWKYEKGQILPKNGKNLHAKVEVKNINSFRALEKAIAFEIARQTEMIEKGETILAETRGWNEQDNATVSQRQKESAADYRYFPEPDIPAIAIDDAWLEDISSRLVELPDQKEKRLMKEYGLSLAQAEVIASSKALADWTEHVLSELSGWIEAQGDSADRQDKKLAQNAANWIINELAKYLNIDKKEINETKISAENFAELVCLVYQGKTSYTAGQTILKEMYENGGDPTDIMEKMGLAQLDDTEAIRQEILKVIGSNKAQAEEYRQGKEAIFQFFIGKTMAATKGKANPQTVAKLLKEELKK